MASTAQTTLPNKMFRIKCSVRPVAKAHHGTMIRWDMTNFISYRFYIWNLHILQCDIKSCKKGLGRYNALAHRPWPRLHIEAETNWPLFSRRHFKCIFFNENVRISIKISVKFVPKGPINNIPGLVKIMAWRQPGDKPLHEPMMVSLLTHMCVLGLNELKWLVQIMPPFQNFILSTVPDKNI